jgi:HD-GYP domain-containing protein (c-di-GMP phosphodiesterase class II)
VAFYAVGVGRKLELPAKRLRHLKIAAELHDIGKIAIPEEIIHCTRKLTEAQHQQIRRHPELGVEILRPIRFLEPCLPTVLHHHERFDGKGYPAGFAGEQIPLEARILNLADAFDAMTTQRPYNRPKTFQEALVHCRKEAGASFDPACVEALFAYVEERFSQSGRTDQGAGGDARSESATLSRTSAFDARELQGRVPFDETEKTPVEDLEYIG